MASFLVSSSHETFVKQGRWLFSGGVYRRISHLRVGSSAVPFSVGIVVVLFVVRYGVPVVIATHVLRGRRHGPRAGNGFCDRKKVWQFKPAVVSVDGSHVGKELPVLL